MLRERGSYDQRKQKRDLDNRFGHLRAGAERPYEHT